MQPNYELKNSKAYENAAKKEFWKSTSHQNPLKSILVSAEN